ncbi:hypothetical protein FQZ97_1272430 [compost metagenome]
MAGRLATKAAKFSGRTWKGTRTALQSSSRMYALKRSGVRTWSMGSATIPTTRVFPLIMLPSFPVGPWRMYFVSM